MTVKRFVAPSAREALRRVKEELGPDAIVVANKSVPGGVEITAMSADRLDALAVEAAPRPAAQPASRPAPVAAPAVPTDDDDYTVSLSAKAHAQAPFRAWQPQTLAMPVAETKPRLRPLPSKSERDVPSADHVAATLRHAATEGGVPPRLTSDDAPSLRPPPVAAEPQVSQLMAEMQTIKALLERQLAGFAWGEMSRQNPAQAMLLAELLDAGFSSALSRRLIDELPGTLAAGDGRKWLVSAINRRLRTLSGDNDIIDQGGVFALVGPTGVGKTTTTAKLAARCVVRYGADKLALLTTDGYRIGAHEQLRIYGRILGVPVHVVRDSEDLRRTLVDLRDKHMILIDTVGMSQRDRMVAEQAAMLTRAGEVRRLLLLNAGSRGDTLDDVVRAYAGEDLAGCILTKVDEAAALGPALDAIVRHGLLLAYVANGQRVPEDLHLPNRNYLLHRAFKLPQEASPHRLHEDDVGLVMAPSRTVAPSPLGATLG
ncbi:MAG TPA: flagellar biosynthesis protein FlhF [Rhodocyclaceae bacterium]|nr:flagellar biosynthesis protein FlhF [Rhodocyclaceae bacterium]